MIVNSLNRLIKAADVARLPDGTTVAIRCDTRRKDHKFGTVYYKVETIKGVKVLIRKDPPHVIRLIRDRPGFYYSKEVWR